MYRFTYVQDAESAAVLRNGLTPGVFYGAISANAG